jgi:hypothetical protein
MHCRQCMSGNHHMCAQAVPTIVGHRGAFRPPRNVRPADQSRRRGRRDGVMRRPHVLITRYSNGPHGQVRASASPFTCFCLVRRARS